MINVPLHPKIILIDIDRDLLVNVMWWFKIESRMMMATTSPRCNYRYKLDFIIKPLTIFNLVIILFRSGRNW